MLKRPVIVTGIILSLSIIITFLMYSTVDEYTVDDIFSRHNNMANQRTNTNVTTVINNVENMESTAGVNTASNNSNPINIPGVSPSNGTWISMVDTVHKTWGAQGLTYRYGGTANITMDGQTYTVRTDCSGFVGFCIHKMGWSSTTTPISSSSDLTVFGFTKVDPAARQPGDVLAYSGHVEVLQAVTDAKDSVWNWGGTSSTSAKYANGKDPNSVISYGNSGKSPSALVAVWRPPS